MTYLLRKTYGLSLHILCGREGYSMGIKDEFLAKPYYEKKPCITFTLT